jgi:transposase
VDLGDAIVSWKPAPTGRHGAQKKFSDHAIETALTLRTVFKLPLRRAEGFLRSVLSLMSVDRSGLIVAEALTHASAGDAKTALDLIDEVEGDIMSITADAAYDTIAINDAAAARGVGVVVPPIKTATRSRRLGPLPCARDRTIMRVQEIGRRRWKKESGYHQQAHVENTFFRYKSIIGHRLRARHPKSQEAEALIACNILNLMTEIGRPESISISA